MIDDDFTAFGNKEVTYGNSAFSQAKDVHEWNYATSYTRGARTWETATKSVKKINSKYN